MSTVLSTKKLANSVPTARAIRSLNSFKTRKAVAKGYLERLNAKSSNVNPDLNFKTGTKYAFKASTKEYFTHNVMLGWEWEIENTEGGLRQYQNLIKDLAKDLRTLHYGWLGSDGGYREVRSVPCTAALHKELLIDRDVFKTADNEGRLNCGYRVHDSTGGHIHIGLASIPNCKTLARMFEFLRFNAPILNQTVFNRSYGADFSTDTNYHTKVRNLLAMGNKPIPAKWSKPETYIREVGIASRKGYKLSYRGKTVELRSFRSPKTIDGVVANLQFCDAFVRFCSTDDELTYDNFVKFVRTHNSDSSPRNRVYGFLDEKLSAFEQVAKY